MKSKIITIISILLLTYGAYNLGCQKKAIEEIKTNAELTNTNTEQTWIYVEPKINLVKCDACGKEYKRLAFEDYPRSVDQFYRFEYQDSSVCVCLECVVDVIRWVIDEYKNEKD